MTRQVQEKTERLLELLTERTDRALEHAENDELSELLDAHPEWDEGDIDLAAAAVYLAFQKEETEPLPKHLEERILKDALEHDRAPTFTRGAATAPSPVDHCTLAVSS